MSLINEYRETEEALKELQARLDQMSKDDRLQKEIEFEKQLRALMGDYNKSLKDIINILDPQAKRTAAPAKTPRAERKVKVYINPNNGERIETKGGNHKQLKEWKQEFGADVVEGWLQS